MSALPATEASNTKVNKILVPMQFMQQIQLVDAENTILIQHQFTHQKLYRALTAKVKYKNHNAII